MRVRLDPTLPSRGFAFRVNAIRTAPRIGIGLNSIQVNDTAERMHLLGVTAVPSVNPVTGQPGSIAPAEHRELLEAAGLTVWDAFGYYILVLAGVIRHHAAALMSPAQVRVAMAELGKAFPAVTAGFDEADVARVVGPLLRSLLREQISTRNLRHILQLIRRHTVAPEVSFGDDLHKFVRRGLADQIGHSAARGTTTLVVYLLDPAFEGELGECAERDEPVPLELAEEIRNAFYREIVTLSVHAQLPIVLTTEKCRIALLDILRAEYPATRVLDYQDIPGHYNIQPIARISR
jgi:flagellar biosynthesis component FlhA